MINTLLTRLAQLPLTIVRGAIQTLSADQHRKIEITRPTAYVVSKAKTFNALLDSESATPKNGDPIQLIGIELFAGQTSFIFKTCADHPSKTFETRYKHDGLAGSFKTAFTSELTEGQMTRLGLQHQHQSKTNILTA